MLSEPSTLPDLTTLSDPTVQTRRPRAFIDAATQIENLGDDVILRQLLRLLEKRADVQVDVSNVPEWARDVIDIDPLTADARPGFSRRLLAAGLAFRFGRSGQRPMLFLKPGHIGGRYGARYSLGRVGLLGLTLLCRALGVTVVRLGFSVNDCQGALLHLERLQSRAQHVYAPRDDVSTEYAHEVGIRVNGRSADLAYTLGVVDDPAQVRSGVVLSFAGSTDGHVQPAYADQLAEFLRAYLDQRPDVGHTWCAQVVRDAAYGDRVLTDHLDVARVGFERSADSADRIFSLYAGASLVLTNRLHSFLFALSQGALAVVVTDPATHGKIVGIIEEMGLPELLVPLAGLTPAGLQQAVDDLDRRRAEILPVVRRYFDEQTARLESLLDEWVGPPADLV
jgi:polysaccharide pyruvyl transferase WcaK-like protein